MLQREHRTDHAIERGERVADRDTDARRRPVRRAGDVAQPAHRFANDAETRALMVRTGLSVTGDANHDQSGVDRGERRVIEAPSLERARAEILDDDVGAPGERSRDCLSLRLAQSEAYQHLVV